MSVSPDLVTWKLKFTWAAMLNSLGVSQVLPQMQYLTQHIPLSILHISKEEERRGHIIQWGIGFGAR